MPLLSSDFADSASETLHRSRIKTKMNDDVLGLLIGNFVRRRRLELKAESNTLPSPFACGQNLSESCDYTPHAASTPAKPARVGDPDIKTRYLPR
jgi:hypothetical protein